jgi:hypothetical protein
MCLKKVCNSQSFSVGRVRKGGDIGLSIHFGVIIDFESNLVSVERILSVSDKPAIIQNRVKSPVRSDSKSDRIIPVSKAFPDADDVFVGLG